MNIGLRISKLRAQRGLTTNKLANLSGLSQSFVRSVELGEKGITIENLQFLCDALHISLQEFFAEIEGGSSELDRSLSTCISLLSQEQKKALLLLLDKS